MKQIMTLSESDKFEEVITPEELKEYLEELLTNDEYYQIPKKILIVGSPTGGKTSALIELFDKYKDKIVYLHAHRSSAKYRNKNHKKIEQFSEI